MLISIIITTDYLNPIELNLNSSNLFSDITGNYKADELIRAGITLQLASRKVGIYLLLAICKYSIDKHVINMSLGRVNPWLFQQAGRCGMNGIWAAHAVFLKLKRNDIRNLVEVLTGHCLLGRHASRLRTLNNDFCKNCQKVEEERRL